MYRELSKNAREQLLFCSLNLLFKGTWGASLWDDLDPDHGDPRSLGSWCTDPDPDHPKGTHPYSDTNVSSVIKVVHVIANLSGNRNFHTFRSMTVLNARDELFG